MPLLKLIDLQAKCSASDQKPGPVPFFAAGVSSVFASQEPFLPQLCISITVISRQMLQRMFLELQGNGGLVVALISLLLTSLKKEDAKHFHSVLYLNFYIKHRDERQGLGGIFF
ncbi:unnamed protein product [Arabidopsis halleri]